VVVLAVSLLAAWRGQHLSTPAPWYGILPPLTAVALALATRRLILSLALGTLLGGFLLHVVPQPGAPRAWAAGLIEGAQILFGVLRDPFNLQILAFVALMLVMISVLVVSGGLQGIVARLARAARGRRSTQAMTALMGLAVFIDDYANTMIVGTSMRPLTDLRRISREKLAFLVDATSAPIAGLAVVSTWIGYEVGLFSDVGQSLGIDKSGYAMFFDALTYRFYCVLMIAFVWLNVLSGRDFGPMARAERRARTSGQVAAPDARVMTSRTFASATAERGARIRARTAALPIAGLFLFLLTALWIDGGGLEREALAWLAPAAWRDVLGQAENNIALLALAAAFGLLLAFTAARWIARLPGRHLWRAVAVGARSSLLPMTILILAWSLKGACDGLGTGRFLVAAVGTTLSPALFPGLLFLISGMTAFATGTSWGTMAILIPTAIPIAHGLDLDAYGLTTMISLGAVLDGAILGDHCSPVSDTTIMSSIASGCDHVHHVATQIPYSLIVGALALVCGYLPAGLGVPSWVGMLGGTSLLAVGLLYRRRGGS